MKTSKFLIIPLFICALGSPSIYSRSNTTNETGSDGSESQKSDALAQNFATPPAAARPRTWWHWVSGNVSKEGITADLEAMKEIGLAGAQIFTVDQSEVKGPVKFMSPEWRGLVHHALDEARRLNLEISMEGCDGWSETGGPWVSASESMQKVVWSERHVTGGQKVSLDLPQPETIRDFYKDIAIYAFPTPDGFSPPAQPAKVTSSDPAIDGAILASGSAATMTVGQPNEEQWVQLEYTGPVSFRSLHFAVTGDAGSEREIKSSVWEVQSSDDGVNFKKLTTIRNGGNAGFDTATAKFFRVWKASVPGKTSKLSVKTLRFGGAELDRINARGGMEPWIEASNFVAMKLSPGEVIDPKSIVNLAGQQEWQAPAGDWTIVRIGHTSTGATTHPSTAAGLECDKLSTAAVQHHIQNMFGPVFADSPDRVGKTLKYILLDSWEAGCENWTPEMAAEFKKRRGYDLLPWLPTLTGKIIASAELTQRFLWDYRRTLADLVAENHYGVIQNYAHEHQMGLASEASGIGMPTVADQLLCKKYTDIPMGEFWVNHTRDGNIDDPKEAACAAHIYGRNFAATESFTSTPNTAAWKNDPYSLKAMGDQEFCLGINRFVFHRYAHQPWLDRQPGMSMGPWGINFERTNTWWKPGSAWISYLARCQYLLQQGRFQADLCYFYGEGAPICVHHGALKPAVPHGYDYDVCNADALLNLMDVKDGRLTLPGGTRYRVLVLPDTDRMTLPLLQKVARLVQAGATVYGPKPAHSPSLANYPESDQTLARLADEVWGPCDGKTVTENVHGKGKIAWGEPLEKALDTPADFTNAQGDLLYIHRSDNPAEIYFISNQGQKELTTDCTFRVTGKIPELWHPDTGKRETLACYRTENGRTILPIHFDPVGSVFVVFRRAASGDPVVAITHNGEPLASAQPGAEAPATSDAVFELFQNAKGRIQLETGKPGRYEMKTASNATLSGVISPLPAPFEITGPWQLTFPPKLGAPASATLEQLASWSDSTDDGIKYFSGTATYKKDFALPDGFLAPDHHLYLDLGSVKNLARVVLNGKPLGVLWKEPFRVDITGAARPGVNHLTLEITNLWPNRLIGDQKLPEAQRITWASVSLYKPDSPLLPSGLLGPVKILSTQTISVSK
jgi:hypothetical protein